MTPRWEPLFPVARDQHLQPDRVVGGGIVDANTPQILRGESCVGLLAGEDQASSTTGVSLLTKVGSP